MPRFVLLKHSLPPESPRGTHWDFMLEMGEALRTWALEDPPESDREIAALPLANHRLEYLEYEGPVSGNRGHVERVDRGEYTLVADLPDRCEVVVRGAQLRGLIALWKASDDQRWCFVLRADADRMTASKS